MFKKLVVALLTLVLLLTGCSQPNTPTEAVQEPGATVTQTETAMPDVNNTTEPTESTRTFVPTFEEGTCPFEVPASDADAVECGFVIVPEDHSNPEGPTIRIAVAILKDQGDAHQPDPVMLLHGGPGERTVARALGLGQLLAPLRSNRDLIVFDQRGVGSSEPALECPEIIETYLSNLAETDPHINLQAGFEAWMTCRDHLVEAGHNLSAYNTTQNAADVDAIRSALGYEQVNLYGASYGSHLAQAVIRDHPEAIRSAVIASVWPLDKSLTMEQATNNANGILRLTAACTADEACNTAYPNLQDTLFEIVDRLNTEPVSYTLTHPLSGETYAAFLTGDTVVGNLVAFLYLTDAIPVLPQAIYDVYNGNYELMTQLSSTKLLLIGATTRGVMLSTLCTDDLIGQTPEDLLNVMAELPRQLAGSADPEIEIEYGPFGLCEQWPVEEAAPWVREPLVSDVPILVLGSEFDPITPPEYGQVVAGHLSNSYFFEFPGIGHNITTNECARSIAGAFVNDPDQTPDASCIDELPAVAFIVPVENADIEFESYTNSEMGIQGVVPVGWTEVQPGIFARSSPTVDMAVFQVAVERDISVEELLKAISEGYGLDGIPEISAERKANDLTWSLYTFEVQDVPRDLALAESEGLTIILLLRSAADEHDALHEAVFLPIVDALTLLGAETAAEDEGTPEPEASAGEPQITLVSYTSEDFGISGLVPEGWAEASPGIYARGSSATDITVLLAQTAAVSATDLLTTLASQLGLDELPESIGERQANGLTWALYTIDVEGVVRDIALTDSEGFTFIVLLRSAAEERDALHGAVFLPIVDALTLVE
ncbi:MAG: alpha/beta hydrolase [Gammaproteobacteria bacterium]|nr:alpha/beta hydrolase [Gammaproteobacteria bacterium]